MPAAKRTFKTKKPPIKSEPEEEVVKADESAPETVEEPAQAETAASPAEESPSVVDDSPTVTSSESSNEVGMYESTSEETPTAKVEPEVAPPDTDEPDNGMVSKIKWVILALVLVGVLGAVSFLSYEFGRTQAGKSEEAKTAIEDSSPSPTPEEEEDEDVNLSSYTLAVLNGSGTSGEASSLQKTLDSEGFNVTTIGNAQDDVDVTLIEAKESVSAAFLKKLITELEKTYAVEADVEELSEDSEEDVVITIGSEKAEE